MFSILPVFQQTGPLVVAEPTGQGGLTVIRLSRKAGGLGTVKVSWKVGELFFSAIFKQIPTPSDAITNTVQTNRRTETGWF